MTEPARDSEGRWLQGTSGNPVGKAKGVRNEITLQRLEFEKALREYVANPARATKLLRGIDKVLDIACNAEKEKDSISAMKLLLDRVMPAMPPQVSEEAAKTDRRLTIVITNDPNATAPVRAVIDGEYTEE